MEQKLIEKIQKLISLSESPNENEAKAAMAKAQSLMLKHNIDMRQVKDHDSEYINQQSEIFKRQSVEIKFINDILDKYFFVKVVKSKRYDNRGKSYSYFNYVGEKENIKTAMHMRDFLQDTFKRLWLEYKKANNLKASSKQSFLYGLYEGFCEKMEQQRQDAQNEYGLVLVDDPKATEKMNELFNNLKSTRAKSTTIRDSRALNAGKSQGKSITSSKAFLN